MLRQRVIRFENLTGSGISFAAAARQTVRGSMPNRAATSLTVNSRQSAAESLSTIVVFTSSRSLQYTRARSQRGYMNRTSRFRTDSVPRNRVAYCDMWRRVASCGHRATASTRRDTHLDHVAADST